MFNLKNIAISLLLVLSGIVIINCFRRLKMTVAKNVFILLWATLLLYIPICTSSEIIIRICGNAYGDSFLYSVFVGYMRTPIFAVFPFFSGIAVAVAAASLIVFIATVIFTLWAALRIICFIRKFYHRFFFRDVSAKKFPKRRVLKYIVKKHRLYLSFCRLLN